MHSCLSMNLFATFAFLLPGNPTLSTTFDYLKQRKKTAEKIDTNAQWFHCSWSILLKRVNIRVRGFHLFFSGKKNKVFSTKSWNRPGWFASSWSQIALRKMCDLVESHGSIHIQSSPCRASDTPGKTNIAGWKLDLDWRCIFLLKMGSYASLPEGIRTVQW